VSFVDRASTLRLKTDPLIAI